MSLNHVTLRRVGLATAIERGQGIYLPQSGTSGGGEFGANISDMHRHFAMTREPAAYRIVFGVANACFNKWFNLTLKEEDKPENSETFDQAIQELLSDLHAKQELNRMSVFERGFGWGLLVLGYEDGDHGTALSDSKDPGVIKEIKSYGPQQIGRIREYKNDTNPKYGFPETYNIQRKRGTALTVHESRTILFATRPKTDHAWQGYSTLDKCWDDIVTLRNIRWSCGQTLFRYGAGFADLTFHDVEKKDIDEWEAAGGFSNISNRTYFAHTPQESIEFKGASGHALDPLNYYLIIIESISLATGIPKPILRGAQAGALTGSQVNERSYWSVVTAQQTLYEDGIRNLITRLYKSNQEDTKKPLPDFTFKWKGGFELTEDQKLDNELKKLSALRLRCELQSMTRNELRAEIDPSSKKLTEEQGGEELVVLHGGTGPEFRVTEIPKNYSRGPSGQSS